MPKQSASNPQSAFHSLTFSEVAGLLRTALADWSEPSASAPDHLAIPDPPDTNGSAESASGAGTLIGRYRLLELLGEGGFGLVWKAEQVSPIRRLVALKIVKSGVACSQVLARFNAERQTLALMDHPGIAAVLEAGATPLGQPYFVMELVPGEPVTAACRRLGLNLRQRLIIIQQICKAVQHAHQKGVLHRDLKPSNILLCEDNGEYQPKIIDFGIAKAREAPSFAEAPLLTRADHLLGTPDYMSPEQTILGNQDLDTRTDIYSLGAILYELLTGFPPLHLASCQTRSLSDALSEVRSREPTPPSMAVQRLLQTAGPDQPPGDPILREPGYLEALRGDLDWITLKALAKNRDERYESADALAADIASHLDDLPVNAGRPSVRYRTRKFLRRNKTLVFSSLALLGVLSFSIILVTRAWIAERASRALADHMRDLALANAETAEHESERARETLQFLDKLLDETGEMVRAGKNPEALRLALDKLSADPSVFGTNPEIQQAILGSTAKIYRALRNDAKALPLFERQAALLAGLRSPDAPDLLESRENLARSYFLAKRHEDSLREYRDIVTIRKSLAHTRDGLRKLFLLERNYLDVLAKTGHLDLALAEYQLIHDTANEEIRGHSSWPVFLRNHGEALIQAQRLEEAEKICREGLAMLDLSKATHLHHAAGLHGTLATLHTRRRDLEAAIQSLESSIRFETQSNGPISPWLPEWRVAISRLQAANHQHDDAIENCRNALRSVNETANEAQRIPVLRALADHMQADGQYEEAARLFEQCVDHARSTMNQPDHNLVLDQGQHLVNLCLANRSEEARSLLAPLRAAASRWLADPDFDYWAPRLQVMLGYVATRAAEDRNRPPPEWAGLMAQRLARQHFPALQSDHLPPTPQISLTSADWLAAYHALHDRWLDSDPAANQMAEAAFLRLAGRPEQAVRVYLQLADRPGVNLVPDRHLTARWLAAETLLQLDRPNEAGVQITHLRSAHEQRRELIHSPWLLAMIHAWPRQAPKGATATAADSLSPTAPPQTSSPPPPLPGAGSAPVASP